LKPASESEGAEGSAAAKGGSEAASPNHGRVLVVEDEFLLATALAQDLKAAGYDVVGPFASLSSALAAVAAETFDLAILDINLRGEMVYPVAADLAGRQIPFVFLSGYTASNMPDQFRSYPRLSKPIDSKVMLQRVKQILASKLA
jgi:DNA-binding response OmpR family regulator